MDHVAVSEWFCDITQRHNNEMWTVVMGTQNWDDELQKKTES